MLPNLDNKKVHARHTISKEVYLVNRYGIRFFSKVLYANITSYVVDIGVYYFSRLKHVEFGHFIIPFSFQLVGALGSVIRQVTFFSLACSSGWGLGGTSSKYTATA